MTRGQGSAQETERRRLADLHELNVLDTPAEAQFDFLTELASDIYDVPIALVSLIDESRQWWKSKVGLDACETPREISFCTHAIRGPDVFVVHDALTHPRFATNPLVTGEPGIRFYAGAPLVTRNGFRVGTLCIIDRRPRTELEVSDLGNLSRLAGLVVELLERRRADAELAEARHRLDQAKMRQARFLATASHEIRTPLSAVSSLTDLAYAKSDSDEQRVYLGKIRAMNRVLLGLLDDVLDVSRIEMGKADRPDVVFDPYDVLDRVVGILGIRSDVRDLRLSTRVASDVPSRLTGDETRLFQILLNLVNNAIKFTDHGSVDVAVRVKSRAMNSVRLLFSVHDTGIGIPEDRLEIIFQELERGGDGPAPRGSAGLGLAIVRRFVTEMGGTVSVRSAVGHGSTFEVDVEFGLTRSAVREPGHGLGDDPPERGDLKGLRVLLVEDSELSREAVQGLLEYAGATVDTAADGETAVEIVTTGSVDWDVVLMDLGLPGMDGLQATHLIRRSRGPDVLPIIGFSADTTSTVESRCLNAGMNAYLRKPAAWDELSAIIVATVARPTALDHRTSRPSNGGGPRDPGTEFTSPEALRVQLSGMFRERYRDAADFLRGALARDEHRKVESYLHTMRGAASLIGIAAVATAAKSLETAVHHRVETRIDDALLTFERELSLWLNSLAEPPRDGDLGPDDSGQAGSGTNR